MNKSNYQFLKDPRAIEEIRRHKWLESEKAGREVGFATAALDWILRYGPAWEQAHASVQRDYTAFLERRRFRRFKLSVIADIVKNGIAYSAQVIDLSISGVLCRTKEAFAVGERLEVKLSIATAGQGGISCSTQLARAMVSGTADYQVFLKFDELSQSRLGQYAGLLT